MDQFPQVSRSELLHGKNEFRRDGDSSASGENWLKKHEQEVTVALGAAAGLAALAWGGSRLLAVAGKKAAVEGESALLLTGAEIANSPSARSKIAGELASAAGLGVPRGSVNLAESSIGSVARAETLTAKLAGAGAAEAADRAETLAARFSTPLSGGVARDTRSLLAQIQAGHTGSIGSPPYSDLERAVQMLSESADKVRAAKAGEGAFQQLSTGIPTPSHHEVNQWVRLTMHDAGPTRSAPLVDQSMRELLGFEPQAGTLPVLDEALLNAERADPSNPFAKFMPGLRFEMPGLSVRAKKTIE